MTDDILTAKEKYEYIAHQIEREDILVDTRIKWMLTFQGFLFSALALTSNEGHDHELYLIFQWLIPALGIVVSGFTFMSVQAAFQSLQVYKNIWTENKKYGRFNDYPPPFLETDPVWGYIYTLGFPSVIIFAWFLVLCSSHYPYHICNS